MVGCHEQLRDPEVRLVTGVPHVLEEVGRIGADLAEPPRGAERPRDGLAPAEQRLLEALRLRRPLSCEEAAVRAGVPLTEAMRLLPGLALRGFAQRREHGFVLAPTRAPAGASAPPEPSSQDEAGAAA